MHLKSVLQVALIFCLIHLSVGYSSVNPVWLTSNYMRAGNEDVIKVLTGQAIDPIYTFTFSSALPGVPNLAYGIKRYRGADYLGVEQFQIRRLNLTASTFTVQVDIIGTTNLYILNVPYIAVDPTFPHHLNSFDNVPISYGQTLVNITAKVTGTTSYTNVINYTQQSVGRKYTKFGTPVNGNKMLLYICALHIWATFRSTNAKTNVTTYFPINLDVVYDIETESTYRLTASLSTNVMIAKLHFSQIVYNADDVESSKKYVIVYQLWKTESVGGFLAFPQEFMDNFIMGVTDFGTIDGRCGFEYQWNYVTKNGQFGVEILESKQVSGDCGFSKMTSTVFYMKTWQCPQTNPYFNLTTNQCQDLCGMYHYENTTVLQCQPCQFACTKCLNAATCIECDANVDHRRLTTVKTKKICACSPGYFQDPRNSLNKVCLKCIANCVTCKTSTTCELCDEDKGYALDANKKCILCGYGCAACQSTGAQCTTCRQTFMYNQTSKTCQCQPGKYLDKPTISCLACHQKCSTCSGPTQYQCLTCPPNQNRIPLPQANGFLRCICNPYNYIEPQDSSPICVKKSEQSCDYGYIYIKEDKKCVEICGDGKNFGQFQCDDGNRVDGDGCSKTCKVEQGFSCQVVEGLSTCSYVGAVDIVNAQAFKNPFGNTLLVKCELSPIKQFFYSLRWKQGLVLVGPKMSVIDAWMQNKWLTINITYFQDLTGKTLTIKYSSTLAKTSSPHRTLFSSVFDFDLTLRDYNLPIEPVNNLKPTYLQQQTYDNVKIIQRVSFVIGILTICFVGVAIFMKSVFGLWQIVLGLQVMFLSLGSVKSMNPILAGLTQFSFIKGFRSTKIYFETLVSPNQVIEPNISVLGYVTSFFGNMNIMLFLQLATILLTGALYLMSKKDLTMQFPFQFAKRQLMLLIVFNAMNLVFSCCIMSTPKVFEICLAIGFGLIMLVQIFHFLSSLKQYYFLDKTFNLQNTKIKYLLGIIMLVRILQSIAIALLKHHTLMSTIALLILQGLWTIIFTIFRPYEKSLYNILNMLTEWSVTGFLTINLLVNLQVVSAQETENILSVGQIAIYYLIVLLFLIGLFYAIFSDCCTRKKLQTKIKLNDSSPRKSSRDEGEKQVSPKRQKRKLQSDFYIQDIDDTDYTLGRSQEIKLFQNSNNRRKRSSKE